MELHVAIAPEGLPNTPRASDKSDQKRRETISAGITRAGGHVVPINEANALVWLSVGEAEELEKILNGRPEIEWVQLPWAGVEKFAGSSLFHRSTVFTCAKGSYAEQVAEHALTQILLTLRQVVAHARTREWLELEPHSLHRKQVTILGGGGIATELVRILKPFNCTTRLLRRSSSPVPGATETLPITALHTVLPETDVLVLALSLTPETTGIIGADELAMLPSSAIIANVARGGHIDTAALVDALQSGAITAAALDVTDPEPLPADHPLWQMDNVYISSHCADSVEFVSEQLTRRITENVSKFLKGEQLEGVVDTKAGY